jgi:hypothetical protein
MKYIIISVLLLTACAQKPARTPGMDSGNALGAELILKKCPNDMKIKAGRETYYQERLIEGKVIMGAGYKDLVFMKDIEVTLQRPEACKRIAGGITGDNALGVFLEAK